MPDAHEATESAAPENLKDELEKAEAKLKEAEAKLKEAKIELEKAEAKLEKARTVGSPSDIKDAEEEIAGIRLEVTSARAAMLVLQDQVTEFRKRASTLKSIPSKLTRCSQTSQQVCRK